MDAKRSALVAAIRSRFAAIEASLSDLRIGAQKPLTVSQRAADPLASLVYRNRLSSLLLGINHLKDDVKRLAKCDGLGSSVVDDFCEACHPISLCFKAADTYKHGLGGRAKNNTVIVHEIVVVKTPQGQQPTPDCETRIVGALIADVDGNSHDSNVVCASAIREWASFLQTHFTVDLSDWLDRVLPVNKGPHVLLSPDVQAVVPLGAVLHISLPREIREAIARDASIRAKAT